LVEDGIINKQKIIIFIASAVPEQEIQTLLDKGAYTCIRKPPSMNKIIDVLKN